MAGAQIGRPLQRFEEFALLTGRGRFADDLPVPAGMLHAAILRSSHPHADTLAIDTTRARGCADYAAPTSHEIPAPVILHHETPSPVTPLGARGVGEGNAMSTPVCLANAVADALGATELTLPLTPSRLTGLLSKVPWER